METQKVTFRNTEINVTGTFYKGGWGTWETMPISHNFEVDSVDIDGADITELLEDDINEISNLVIDTYYS
jgi:hypothetical protein